METDEHTIESPEDVGAGSMSPSTSLLAFDPSGMDVRNACMSYRHDFGLLPDAEKKELEFDAREWLRAWGHTLPQFKANSPHQPER